METTDIQLLQHAKDELSPQMVRQFVSMQDSRKKSTPVGIALALLIGGLGAHKFYLGENTAGIVYLLCGTVGWTIIIPGFIVMVLSVIDACLMSKSVYNYNKSQGYALISELKMIES